MEPSEICSLQTLHQDVLCLVLAKLSVRDLIAVAATCRVLRTACVIVAKGREKMTIDFDAGTRSAAVFGVETPAHAVGAGVDVGTPVPIVGWSATAPSTLLKTVLPSFFGHLKRLELANVASSATIGAFILGVANGAPVLNALDLKNPTFAAAANGGYIPYDVYKMRMFRRWCMRLMLTGEAEKPASWENDPFFADIGFKLVKRVHPLGGGGGGECVLVPMPLHTMVPVHPTAPKDTLHKAKQSASAALHEAEQLMCLGNVLQNVGLRDGGGEADADPSAGAADAVNSVDVDVDGDAVVQPAPTLLPSLRSFALSGARSTLRELADVWWRMPELESLVMDECALERHSDVLDGLPSVQHGGICAAAAICPKLTEIGLRKCRGFGGIDAGDLVAAAAHAPNLEHFDLTWQMQYMQMDPCLNVLSSPQHGFSHLQSIALQGVWISNEALLTFAQGCQQLKHLWLVGCGHDGRLSGDGVVAALDALPAHQMLSLSLSACPVDIRPVPSERRRRLTELVANSHGKSLRVLSMLSLDTTLDLFDVSVLSQSFPKLARFEFDGDCDFPGDLFDPTSEAGFHKGDQSLLNSVAFGLLLECSSLRWLRVEGFQIPWEVLAIAPRFVAGGEAASRKLEELQQTSSVAQIYWVEFARCLEAIRQIGMALLCDPVDLRNCGSSSMALPLLVAVESFGPVADRCQDESDKPTPNFKTVDLPVVVIKAFSANGDAALLPHVSAMPASVDAMGRTSRDVLYRPDRISDAVVAEAVLDLKRVNLFDVI